MFSEVAEIALVAARLGQFQQLLKTRVILILNFTRPHAITYTKQSSYRTLLNKSNLMTLQNRRLQDIAVLYVHCSPYNLRVSEFIPRFTTKKYGKHSLTYLGPKLWNGLPGKIRSQPSLGSFKHRIRKCDLSLIVDESNCLNLILCNS